jgi:hypothetical protein
MFMYHETKWAQEASAQWQRLIPAVTLHFIKKSLILKRKAEVNYHSR